VKICIYIILKITNINNKMTDEAQEATPVDGEAPEEIQQSAS
jgi:hypothetical protein